MKKTLLLLSALSICTIAVADPATTNTTPEQEKKLAEWVKEKKSIDEIVKNAEIVNKGMKPEEGIACARHLQNGKIEVIARPNNEKNTGTIQERANQREKIWEKIYDTVKDKKPGESSSLSYTYDGESKQAEIYRINHEDICLAYWIAPAAKP